MSWRRFSQYLLSLADSARHRARQGRWPAERATGRRGEDLAHRYLERQGMRVVARNYWPHSGHGEIDLIAWDRETLVFVEVKSRHSNEFGDPDRNVDREKRRALLRAGREYARHAGVPWDRVRLDVVTVLLTDPPSLAHFRGAFQPTPTL